MSVRTIPFLALLCTLALAAPASAQMPDPQEMLKGFQGMMDFAQDVRVDEKDVASILEHYKSFEPVAEEIGLGMKAQGAEMDFQQAEKHPTYVKWAKDRGLDPDTWGRKMVRAGLLLHYEEMAAMGPQMTQMLAQQKQMLEAQREAMGEDQYNMMVQQMSGWEKGMTQMSAMMEEFQPTDEETAVIEENRDALTGLFGTGAAGGMR